MRIISDLGLSHALESLRAGTGGSAGAGRTCTMETVDSLSAVKLEAINNSEDWQNLLHEARLEDCGVKLQSLKANLFHCAWRSQEGDMFQTMVK